MADDLLTVFVLTYNRKSLLGQSLQAIRQQTYSAFQVFVLDNASSDGTESVVGEFLADPRFHYLRHERNIGATGNYNYALNLAKSKYVCITHDDDIMEPQFLEVLLRDLETDPSRNLVYCDTDAIDGLGNVVKRAYYSSLFQATDSHSCKRIEFTRLYLAGRMNIVCPATVLRTAAVQRHGLRFLSAAGPGSDTHFWMQLDLLEGGVYYHHEVLYRYRLHSGQDSSLAAAVLAAKLYRPGLFLLLQQHAFAEAKAWNRRFIKDIFIDWSKAAYEHRKVPGWNTTLSDTLSLNLGWRLSVLLRCIPRSASGRFVFHKLFIVNLFRFDTVLRKLRKLLP